MANIGLLNQQVQNLQAMIVSGGVAPSAKQALPVIYVSAKDGRQYVGVWCPGQGAMIYGFVDDAGQWQTTPNPA